MNKINYRQVYASICFYNNGNEFGNLFFSAFNCGIHTEKKVARLTKHNHTSNLFCRFCGNNFVVLVMAERNVALKESFG